MHPIVAERIAALNAYPSAASRRSKLLKGSYRQKERTRITRMAQRLRG